MSLTGYGSCYEGLARPRRAYEQCALWKFGTQARVFLGIMQKVDNLFQRSLGFVLSSNIGEGRLDVLFRIDLCSALAKG